jgi:hypothetical protein
MEQWQPGQGDSGCEMSLSASSASATVPLRVLNAWAIARGL